LLPTVAAPAAAAAADAADDDDASLRYFSNAAHQLCLRRYYFAQLYRV